MSYGSAALLSPPLRLRGPVIRGFGRGSKELGIPTANLDADALAAQLGERAAGIYYGWASVGADSAVYAMVMSIGWNPFYKNERRTVEPHLLHTFATDFYGEELRLTVTGYLRPEASFASLDALVAAIHADIAEARARTAEGGDGGGVGGGAGATTASGGEDAGSSWGWRNDPFLAPPPAASGAVGSEGAVL